MCQKVGFELHSESFHILSAYTSHLLLWSMFNISPGNGVFCPVQQELGLWTGPEQQSRAVVNILSSHLGTSRLNPSFLPEVELSLTRNWVSRRTSSFFFFLEAVEFFQEFSNFHKLKQSLHQVPTKMHLVRASQPRHHKLSIATFKVASLEQAGKNTS